MGERRFVIRGGSRVIFGVVGELEFGDLEVEALLRCLDPLRVRAIRAEPRRA
jgi:hypothetical protein